LLSGVVAAVASVVPALAAAQVQTELAGNALASYPHFEHVRAFNADAPVQVAVDPIRFPGVVGVTADIYVLAARPQWNLGDVLADAGSGPETFVFGGPDVTANIVTVAAPGELAADAGTDIGVGYDVVVDLDRDGLLGSGDLIDHAAAEAGFYVMKDLVTAGPLATQCVEYGVSGVTPGFSREVACYPASLGTLGQIPLVVVSHGNGHDYRWYGYLQRHLASHGYLVMSHQNNTQPGIETAATTTLQHTDAFLGQLGTIAGGIFLGHVDASRIAWIGHSRGGEGVARAIDRILDGSYVPTFYAAADIVLISSIAPTDFLGPASANPHGVNYHLLYGAADGDVSGEPGSDIAQAFHLLERATGFRQSTYLHGADHNDFNCCGFEDFMGPPGTAIGRAEAQRVTKAVYLALLEHYVDGNVPGKDYLWRQYERFKPIGVSAATTVVSEYKEGPASGKFVIDDYQSAPSVNQSSSGGLVLSRVDELLEGRLDDANFDFSWTASDPFNGLTRGGASDSTAGAMLSTAPGQALDYLLWVLPAGGRDASGFEYLSFRACQGPRHPLTVARQGDESWFVWLVDASGRSSFIQFGVYGGGIEEPYQRTGSGAGAGWQAELETVRIRLADFTRGRPGVPAIDLANLAGVGFLFLDAAGQSIARICLDDLEFTAD
jgi:hypothetical protein